MEVKISHSYPSDITRNQFKKIRSILEHSRKITRPRTVDLYDVFYPRAQVRCSLCFTQGHFVKSGCQWRMLPKDYPNWELCYYYFSVWSNKKDEQQFSIIEQVLKKLVAEARILDGRKAKTSFVIIDAQSE